MADRTGSISDKAQIVPIGSFVSSPGGTCLYEIVSEPILRKYLDFKGLFDKPLQTKRLTEELDELEDINDVFLIRSFFSNYRAGTTYKMPSIGRMFWVWLALLLGSNAPHWYLNIDNPLCPYWKMFHADESNPEKKGKNYFRSYYVKVWFQGSNGWVSNQKTKILTIRWQPQVVDFDVAA